MQELKGGEKKEVGIDYDAIPPGFEISKLKE
jgi:hypothetical protein